MVVRAYLRASTEDQNAERARGSLKAFVAERGLTIVSTYIENESGAKLDRPELFRLLKDCRRPGDILLAEQVDRLSRLTSADWQTLRAEIDRRQVRVVSLDLPTSWMPAEGKPDEFTDRLFASVNGMMLDVLAAVARKDYEDRRRRQAEAGAKAEGRYKGRPENVKRNAAIATMLAKGASWTQVQAATGCSRATRQDRQAADGGRLTPNATSRSTFSSRPLAAGRGVTLVPENAELTTCRPPTPSTARGRSPSGCSRAGRSRTASSECIGASGWTTCFDYIERIDKDREAALDRLVEDSQREGMGYDLAR